MANESLLLEMFERIKNLETDVQNLKEKFQQYDFENNPKDSNPLKKNKIETTPEMIDKCYESGKKAFTNPKLDIKELADKITQQTGMNKSSAYIYIIAVKCMLDGKIFKRAVNLSALRRFFELIKHEFGEYKLADAIKSARMHVDYRRKFGHQVDSIERICNEYSKRS